MQFEANSETEYRTTIWAIVDADIYDKKSMIYALDIEDGLKLPKKYPCIVSLEFEEYESDNRRYAFQACKFIYTQDILTGLSYQEKLKGLEILDNTLKQLEAERDTSGIGFPIDEIMQLQRNIFGIEKLLF